MDDQALLRRYVTEASEEAFEELVRRHVGWMYAAALRQVRDPHLAEDVTQAAFMILAGKGRSIGRGTILSGWLLRTVRYTAQNALRMESRRRRHEQEAAMLRAKSERDENQWEDVAEALEPAVAKLGQSDRDAIALRFYERLPQAQVAAALGISEPAAGKRVARAVERLREALGQDGCALSTATLSGMLTTQLVNAAPAGLASAIAMSVAAGQASSNVSAIAGITLRAMGLMKAKAAAMAAMAAIVIMLPVGVWMTVNGHAATQTPAAQPQQKAAAVSQPAAALPDTAHIRTAHVVGPEYEVWLERGVGVAMREIATGALTFSDGQRQWRQLPGQSIVGQWRTRLSPEIYLQHIVTTLAEHRPRLKRDASGDGVIGGVPCELWVLPMEDGRVGKLWIDHQGVPHRISSPFEGQEVRLEYNVPIDRARLTPPAGPELQVVDIDQWFEERFPIDSALYKEDLLGGHFTVHDLQRGEGDEVYLVLANRLSETTANEAPPMGIEAPPMVIEPFMMRHYVATPSLHYAARDERSTHRAYRLAAASGDRWEAVWYVLVPKRNRQVEATEMDMRVYMTAAASHVHDWLKSKGVPTTANFRIHLPVPDRGPRRPLDVVLEELYDQATRWHPAVRWFSVARTVRQEEGTFTLLAPPGEITKQAFIETVTREVDLLGRD